MTGSKKKAPGRANGPGAIPLATFFETYSGVTHELMDIELAVLVELPIVLA